MESDKGDRDELEDGLVADDLCPTLSQCLMYQACVFNFGNELCKRDPNPETRKNIDTNITCIKDDMFESYLHSSNIQERYFDLLDEYKQKREQTVHKNKVTINIQADIQFCNLDFVQEEDPEPLTVIDVLQLQKND